MFYILVKFRKNKCKCRFQIIEGVPKRILKANSSSNDLKASFPIKTKNIIDLK